MICNSKVCSKLLILVLEATILEKIKTEVSLCKVVKIGLIYFNFICKYVSLRDNILKFYFILFFNYFIVVQLQLSVFTPHHFPLPQPNPPPSLASNPLGFVHMSFIVVPENPSPLPPIILSHLPSGYCQIVLNFKLSGYIFLK